MPFSRQCFQHFSLSSRALAVLHKNLFSPHFITVSSKGPSSVQSVLIQEYNRWAFSPDDNFFVARLAGTLSPARSGAKQKNKSHLMETSRLEHENALDSTPLFNPRSFFGFIAVLLSIKRPNALATAKCVVRSGNGLSFSTLQRQTKGDVGRNNKWVV